MVDTLRGRGRPSAASRQEALADAAAQFRDGRRIDVQAIAAGLGISRATLYRWFGSREGLIGAVLVSEMRAVVDQSIQDARGTGGERVLDAMIMATNRLAESEVFRAFLEQEQAAALRIVTSSAGPVQPKVVAAVRALIERVMAEDGYEPPADPETLAYAIVRLNEAFLYNDAVVGLRAELGRLPAVLAALLGLKGQRGSRR